MKRAQVNDLSGVSNERGLILEYRHFVCSIGEVLWGFLGYTIYKMDLFRLTVAHSDPLLVHVRSASNGFLQNARGMDQNEPSGATFLQRRRRQPMSLRAGVANGV